MKKIYYYLFLLCSSLSLLSGCGVSVRSISDKDHMTRANEDFNQIYSNAESITKPVSLEEAIHRGLKYNLDYRVSLMENVLQNQQLTLENFGMLPKIAASAGYNTRNKYNASQSISLLSKNQSLEPSYSEEKTYRNADLSFSWNVLDFGMSYFQAKQQADKLLIAVERRRQVINSMAKQIIESYWRAVTAQKLLPEVNKLLENIDETLTRSDKIQTLKLKNPTAMLEYKRHVLQIAM